MRTTNRATTTTIGAIMAATLIAGCSSGRNASPRATTASESHPSSASATPTAHTPTPGSGAVKDLAALILPAPAGFAISTSSDVTNGPVTPADFDRHLASTGITASSLGYLTGYDVTYDSSSTSDSVEVTLLRFSNTTGLGRMVSIASVAAVDSSERPARAAVRGIPNLIAIDGTAAASDGTYDHAIIATKGNTLIVLALNTDHGGATPASLLHWATEQYRRL